MLLRWDNRSFEEASLFNPSFCVLLLSEAISNHRQRNGRLMPFPLVFLVLPVVLHSVTRNALPSTTATYLLSWIERNRATLIGFPGRVSAMRDITREAIIFGIKHNILEIADTGELTIGSERKTATTRRTPLFTDEVRECVNRAGFVGRWFADAGTVATVYASFGVLP